MKIAIAIPNKNYRFYNSIKSEHLEARQRRGRIKFYTVNSNHLWEKPIAEETIKALFPKNIPKKNRPFLTEENKDFYAVLYRKQKTQKTRFEKLTQQKSRRKKRKKRRK